MGIVKATYKAPKDDAEVVHMQGVRFFDGEAVELNSDEHEALIAKLRGNPHFDVEGRVGRPPKPKASDETPPVNPDQD